MPKKIESIMFERRDKLIAEQAATIARLTAAHEMQGESLVVLPRWMVSNMEDKLKAQAEEIRTLKSVLRDAEVEINIQTGGGNYSELLGNIRTVLEEK